MQAIEKDLWPIVISTSPQYNNYLWINRFDLYCWEGNRYLKMLHKNLTNSKKLMLYAKAIRFKVYYYIIWYVCKKHFTPTDKYFKIWFIEVIFGTEIVWLNHLKYNLILIIPTISFLLDLFWYKNYVVKSLKKSI